MPVIQILTPTGSRSLELPAGTLTVGRSSECDIVIEDARASRRHCTLQPAGGGYLLRDLGSRNGTRVDGREVSETFLRFGEAFVIGKTVLRLFEQSVPPVEPVDSGETAADLEVQGEPAPVAEIVPDARADEEEALNPEDRLLMRARRDLNNLRTAGADPGFRLDDVVLLNCHGKPMHRQTEGQSETIRTLRLLLYGAFRIRATDMHFDPGPEGCQVRFRVDGKMLAVVLLPAAIGKSLLSAVKVLCELDIAGRRTIQDGSFSVHVKRSVDCRVSIAPIAVGEKLVIRILDTAILPSTIEQLGLSGVMLRQLRSVLELDSGMLIVSGPTGSGKTTTLYTALRSIDWKTTNVVTIEDPIEYHLQGITQMQVDTRSGLTFSGLLKSVLRQDPDVILVGEIRDGDTAQTAMQAAMTGHLVFSTLHARDTIGSIFRLLDLGVEAYLIANAVSLFLAQRLIRVLCPHCKRAFRPLPSQLVQMKAENAGVTRLYTHVGCRRCMNVGFWGRQAIFEVLSFNDNLRDALMTTKRIADIRKAAGEWTHQTLLESGYRKVIEGVTTLEEIARVAQRD